MAYINQTVRAISTVVVGDMGSTVHDVIFYGSQVITEAPIYGRTVLSGLTCCLLDQHWQIIHPSSYFQ